MGNLLLYAGILGVIVVGGYIWYKGQVNRIDQAIASGEAEDFLLKILGPINAKKGMVWNGHNWVDSKTGKVLSQGEQGARSGCSACGYKDPTENKKCLTLCKNYSALARVRVTLA